LHAVDHAQAAHAADHLGDVLAVVNAVRRHPV
jgi:hypothetical protein